ncbi:meiotic chromosome segregation protein P8B7.28c [Aspergillus lentulus]|uniref:Meiotic chromosome segregation protein P8B7.28c n=1 Tax=Aspergillus lentulus TaxID=293939 RepID=A0AAN4PH10_ASPLE|nr:meiotic chromosome segregation protein P8B7.28c [Aspergillus lentulus]
MPPTFRSAYAGGYSDEIKKRIKCGTCNKIRSSSNFSKRQLEALRHAILSHGVNVALTKNNAKCRICSGNQTVELKCCICGKIKSLDEFAKAQRQDRDAARCMNCVQSHTDAEPVLEEPKLLTESELSTAPDTYTTGQVDSRSLIASTQRLTLKAAPTAQHVDNSGERDIGGVSLIEDHNGKENSARGGQPFTAFDSNGVAHHRSGSPSGSPRSVHGGWATWGVDVNSTVTKPIKKAGNSKFAKVPSKRFEKHEAPTMRVPEPIGATVPSDDEAGDDAGLEDYL